MKDFKRIIIISATLVCVVSAFVFAKAGSYDSTYEMTGGVFSKWINPKSKCTIKVKPKVGTFGRDMGVIWAHKTTFGQWDGKQKWTSSTKEGKVTFKSTKKRKVWLRNYTGQLWSGNVSFSWD